MVKWEDFQMAMGSLFNLFTLGEAVIRINNPDELYQAYRMFRDTSIIFCNTNKMTDVDLVASVATNRLRCLDLSKDRSTLPGVTMPDPGHRLVTRALYWYLKGGNFGFKGFPTYLHILFQWDDSKYAVDPNMLDQMQIPQNYLRQVEFLYAANQELYVINEMNPITLIPIHGTNSTALWDEVTPTEETDEFVPIELVHRLNKKRRYPMAILPTLGQLQIQEMAYTYNQALAKCVGLGTGLFNVIFSSFISYIGKHGDIKVCSLPGSSECAEDVYRVMMGGYSFHFTNPEHFHAFASLFDFQALDLVSTYQVQSDPNTGEMTPFWFSFTEWKRVQMDYEEPTTLSNIEFTEEHFAVCKALGERLMYVLNSVQNLTLSMPCLGGTLPPRFVWSLRDLIVAEMDQKKLPPEAKED